MTPVGIFLVCVLLQTAPPLTEPPRVSAVSRFHKVDGKLYRGAQPNAVGLRQLRDLGIRIVINLRGEQDAMTREERRLVESLGMRYVPLPVADGNIFTRSRVVPEDAIRNFFAALDGATGPVFVHCQRGADRTGTLVAMYRIARHGWDNERAYAEARALGMRWWYSGFKAQILAFRPGPELLTGGSKPDPNSR
jgi:protein tyrosine/serine phosphatase